MRPLAFDDFLSTMRMNHLMIFLRAPRIGTVKTRLAAAIGETEACAVYRKLTERLVGQLEGLPNVELRFSPDDAELEIKPWLVAGWTSHPQGPGDLGERLDRAFANAFEGGAKHAAIIGSDCPRVTKKDVRDAWLALETNDLVLGPARDGGYWLIGLNSQQPLLFSQMAWSTPSVLQETVARARRSDLRIKLLRKLADIDTASDWSDFLAQK
jgi:rSAM/selenodomain-associated transferase 1